jgi:riboflavin biosynthesis pyrimidine reductase
VLAFREMHGQQVVPFRVVMDAAFALPLNEEQVRQPHIAVDEGFLVDGHQLLEGRVHMQHLDLRWGRAIRNKLIPKHLEVAQLHDGGGLTSKVLLLQPSALACPRTLVEPGRAPESSLITSQCVGAHRFVLQPKVAVEHLEKAGEHNLLQPKASFLLSRLCLHIQTSKKSGFCLLDRQEWSITTV